MKILALIMAQILAGLTAVTQVPEDMLAQANIQPTSAYEQMLVEYDDSGTFYDNNGLDRTNEVYRWGAAVTSLYAYLENGSPKYLAGHEVDDSIYDDTVTFLAQAWNITDRTSAEEVIDRVLTNGHNAKCNQAIKEESDIKALIKAIKRDFGDDFTYEDALTIDEDYFKENEIDTSEFYRVKGAACAYVRFGNDCLKGYDYIRLIRVITFSYQIGYLTKEEHDQLIYNIDIALQQQYSSFKDIHECYYFGEMFRLGTKDRQSTSLINDIVKAISEMTDERYYTKIEKRFEKEISFNSASMEE